MSMIPDDVILQIKESADLVSLIGETVELKRTGTDYRGPCPFHGGTHRNFAVIPKKGLYYCYVCHEAGDVFSYYMKRFGLDYPSAVREVAGKSGIVIPEQAGRAGPDPREPLFSALSVAHDWYSRQLRESPEAEAARRYLQGRSLDLEAIAPLGLGYAPRGSEFLAAMGQLGIPGGTLEAAGLTVSREDGTVLPKFRARLLFPIHDLRARVVGFGGRLLGPGEPKYLNSPETPVYHKGGMLYNLHLAKNAIRQEETVILVEGYFDVIRLVLAGVEHVVAPLGTSLTADQATLLRRYAKQAVLLYDSDPAGLKATFRAADELLRHEVRVRVATMPAGEDPDTLVLKGGRAAIDAILHDAVDVFERKIQLLDQKGWFTGVEHRREALDRLLPTIRAAKDPITRELYVSLTAERCGVPSDVLRNEAMVAGPITAAPRAPAYGPIAPKPATYERLRYGAAAERNLLAILISSLEWRARNDLRPDWFEREEYRVIFGRLCESPEGHLSSDFPEQLPVEARRIWSGLVETANYLKGQKIDEIYEGARQTLESRFEFRRLFVLEGMLKASSEDVKAKLAMEMSRLVKELSERFPIAWEFRSFWKKIPNDRHGATRVQRSTHKDESQ